MNATNDVQINNYKIRSRVLSLILMRKHKNRNHFVGRRDEIKMKIYQSRKSIALCV